MDSNTATDWMRRALELAARGRGAVEPNPMVGAIVLDAAGRLVGEGWHRRFGGPHAEVEALDRAGAAAAGGTIFVTLEPCRHHGKTPPCTDRVLASGVRRVVAAMQDPFPAVAGMGIAILTAAGLEVEVGVLEAEARALLAPYLCLLERRRPFVHAKWAMTLDGRIATVGGESQWISNEASRRHAHRFRGLVDAVVVGVRTVLSDDPLLTARPPGRRIPARVVLDSRARTPLGSRLVQTAREIPTIVAATDAAKESAVAALVAAGCECLRLPADASGRADVKRLLEELGSRKVTNVLIEGGGEATGAFLAADCIDAVRVYIAAKLFGGRSASGPVGGVGVASLSAALHLGPLQIETLDGDIFVHAARVS